MKIYLRKVWRIWAKALGEKSGATKQEADAVAMVRTLIVLCYILTNLVIVAGGDSSLVTCPFTVLLDNQPVPCYYTALP